MQRTCMRGGVVLQRVSVFDHPTISISTQALTNRQFKSDYGPVDKTTRENWNKKSTKSYGQ